MKKIFTAVVALAFVATSMSSCKKCYVCDCSGVQSAEYCSKNYTSSQLDALKAACETGTGCSWKTK